MFDRILGRCVALSSQPRIILISAIVGMALTLPALGFGLLLDDYLHETILTGHSKGAELFESRWHLFHFADMKTEQSQTLTEYGILPWWSYEGLKLKFWRPVTVATHILDHALWPTQHWLMHAHSIAWYGLCIVLVGLVYRRLLGASWLAGLAVLLYAIDDAHSIPAGWLANRNTLVAGALGFAVLWAHDRWRKDQDFLFAPLAWGLLILGLLAKESALSTCGYLFAYALFLDQGRWLNRFMTLVPYGLIVVGWRLVYSAQGYGAIGSDTYIDPVHDPVAFAEAVFMRMPPMLFDQMLVSISEPFMFLPPLLQWGHWALSLAGCLVIGVILWKPIGHLPTARFFALGMLLALLPSCATFPSSRLLFFSGVGGVGLVALYLEHVYKEAQIQQKAIAWSGRFLFLLHALLSPVSYVVRMLFFAGLGLMMQSTVANAPLDEAKLPEQTVIGLNAPNIFYTSYIPLLRGVEGKAVPEYVRSLAPLNPLPVPIEIERTDIDTLIGRPVGGYPWYLARSKAHPFQAGDRVILPGLEIEVLVVSDQGRPMEVAFHFEHPLEDERYVWLRFDSNDFVPWELIAIGERVVL